MTVKEAALLEELGEIVARVADRVTRLESAVLVLLAEECTLSRSVRAAAVSALLGFEEPS